MFGKDLNQIEREAIKQLFLGKDDYEIALSIGRSYNGTKNILHSAYVKLGVHTARQLFPLVIASQSPRLLEAAT
jgi:DNA-binding CsgD family transcriptional regulator